MTVQGRSAPPTIFSTILLILPSPPTYPLPCSLRPSVASGQLSGPMTPPAVRFDVVVMNPGPLIAARLSPQLPCFKPVLLPPPHPFCVLLAPPCRLRMIVKSQISLMTLLYRSVWSPLLSFIARPSSASTSFPDLLAATILYLPIHPQHDWILYMLRRLP